MRKAILIVTILFVAVVSTACINNFAVQELNNKAKVSLEAGDYDSAINRLKSSLDLDASIFETHYNLGIAYIKAEKYSEAINSFGKAIELNPKFIDVYYSLGVAHDSYAQELLDKEDDAKVDANSEDQPKLSKEEKKTLAIENYKNALTAYKKYLKMSKDNKDSDDVAEQIKSIEETLVELEG